jgi:hypothetical protein
MALIAKPFMTSSNPTPRYPLLRIAMMALAILALTIALTGIIAGVSVLAWAVAVIALMIFTASFYLKA